MERQRNGGLIAHRNKKSLISKASCCGVTQSPGQWVPVTTSPEVKQPGGKKRAADIRLLLRLRISGDIRIQVPHMPSWNGHGALYYRPNNVALRLLAAA